MPWGGHRHDIPEKYIRYYEATKITPAIDKGYSYPGLTQEELRLLDHAHETAHLIEDWTVISPDEAAAELEERLAKYPNEQGREVIKRLKNAWTTKDWTPDIAIKSFFDLDRLYFRGYLRKRARLRWKGSTTELWKAMGMKLRETLGITLRDDTDTVPVERMILNARLLLLETKPWQSARKQTFATLLHEMIHGSPPLTILTVFTNDFF